MPTPLRVLVVEDSEDDAELLALELRRNGFDADYERVETEAEYRACLSADLDVILCDYNLPHFDAGRALRILQETSLDIPFIIVSGAIGEDLAVRILNDGADDYLIKDRLARLGQAVANALEQKQLRDEKWRADQRLRDSEKRFRALIEHSADVVILLDAGGAITYYGPSLTTVLGYSADECLGRSLFSLMHPDCAESFRRRLTSLRRYLGSTLAIEHRLRHKDGRWLWMEGVTTNLLAEPAVHALVFNYRDITSRKEAQAELQRAHDQLEGRVIERTAELLRTVGALEMEIAERQKAEEALAAEKQRLELLYQLSQDLGKTLNVYRVADKALELIMATLAVFRGEIFLYDTAAERLRLIAAAGYEATPPVLAAGERQFEHGRAELALGESIPGAVAQSRMTLAIPDANCAEHWLPLPNLDDDICSLAAVPLLAADELVGVLNLLSDQEGFFTSHHLPLLQAVATPLALSLQNARLYDEVHAGREQLRRLTHRVVTAQEEERQRLAYQLHEETGQSLSALQINLSLMADELPAETSQIRQKMDDATQLTADTMEQVRSLAQALRPPALEVVGLSPILQKLCGDMARRHDLEINYQGESLPGLPDAYAISFYRFLQEVLTNVVKHAQARNVTVSLRNNGEMVSLAVQDDGRGFDGQAHTAVAGQSGGIGLLGLQERFALLGGYLKINSTPGRGARLVASAPWQEAD